MVIVPGGEGYIIFERNNNDIDENEEKCDVYNVDEDDNNNHNEDENDNGNIKYSMK